MQIPAPEHTGLSPNPLVTTPSSRTDRAHNPLLPLVDRALAISLNSVFAVCDFAVDHTSAEALGLPPLPTYGVAIAASAATLTCAHIVGLQLRERRYGKLRATGWITFLGAGIGGAAVMGFVSGIRKLHETLSASGSIEDALVANTSNQSLQPDPALSQWIVVLALQVGIFLAAMVVAYMAHSPMKKALDKAAKSLKKATNKLLAATSDVAELTAERPRLIDAALTECQAHFDDARGRIHRAERWFYRFLKAPLSPEDKVPTFNGALPVRFHRDHADFRIGN
jgi:hypothetical protein